MEIKRTINGNEVTFELSMEELTKAYYERQKLFRLQDAERQLLQYLGEDDDIDCVADACDETHQSFKDSYGVRLEDVVNPDSPCYILDCIVEWYDNKFEDCNEPENDGWASAVAVVLATLSDAVAHASSND
mgnify:FL=1